MKTTILIFVLFLFSFSLKSSTDLEEETIEQAKVTIHHKLGNGQFIEIEIPLQAVPAHLNHGDHFGGTDGGGGGGCTPPAC